MTRSAGRPNWFRELPRSWSDDEPAWPERQREKLIEQHAAVYPDPERQAWIRRQLDRWFQERER